MFRALLLAGDYFVGGVLSAALTKLHLRLRKMTGKQDHQETAQCMSLIAGIVLLGQDSRTQQMDADSCKHPSPLPRICNAKTRQAQTFCSRHLSSREVMDKASSFEHIIV